MTVKSAHKLLSCVEKFLMGLFLLPFYIPICVYGAMLLIALSILKLLGMVDEPTLNSSEDIYDDD